MQPIAALRLLSSAIVPTCLINNFYVEKSRKNIHSFYVAHWAVASITGYEDYPGLRLNEISNKIIIRWWNFS